MSDWKGERETERVCRELGLQDDGDRSDVLEELTRAYKAGSEAGAKAERERGKALESGLRAIVNEEWPVNVDVDVLRAMASEALRTYTTDEPRPHMSQEQACEVLTEYPDADLSAFDVEGGERAAVDETTVRLEAIRARLDGDTNTQGEASDE